MQLVDIVNHELRTPLASLLGHAELLQGLDLPEDARSSVASIVNAGERLVALAGAVSELAELDAVTSRLNRVPTDPTSLVEDVASSFASRALQRQVRIRVAELHTDVSAVVDYAKVRSALVALVKNAVQHAPEGSSVELEITWDSHVLGLGVKDEGPGMPDDLRAQVLQRVVHLPASGPVGRRGIGLAIADAVAKAHGGALVLAGNDPHGLHARLELPQQKMMRAG